MTVTTFMTADELLRLPDDGWRYELVQGELRKMSPSGARHARVAAQIIGSLIAYLKDHPIGTAYASEAGFRISRSPDTVRAPDAAFVSANRVIDTPSFFEGPPDVAFEVTSPGDTYSEIEEKTLGWLRAGVRAVVIVDPRTSSVRIHRASGATTVADAIEIEEILPSWKLPLSEVFA
jgi:Uma2 family endonuclease